VAFASCKPADALVILPYGSMEGYLVYWTEFSPILVNFGWHRVTVAALLQG